MKNRKELFRSGVYFLIWQNENSEPVAYIGQATTIWKRITDHYKDTAKDFWNHLVAFTTTDDSFTETDINFLERELIRMGKNAERYNIENKTIWNNCLVNEFRESDLLEYIEDLKILLSSLGFQVLQEKISEEDKDEKYFWKTKWFHSYGYMTEEGFLMLKWSEWPREITQSVIKNNWYAYRNRPILEEKWIIEILENKIIFKKDYLFTSPTASAEFVSWWNVNGWDFWKDKNGITLNQLKDRNK